MRIANLAWRLMDRVRHLSSYLKPNTISTRLFAGAGMLLATALLLSALALYYVGNTSRLLSELGGPLMLRVTTANDAVTLLERHRRIVQTAPLRSVFGRASADQKASASIIGQLRATSDVIDKQHARGIDRYLTELQRRSENVFRLSEITPASSANEVLTAYNDIANELQKLVTAARDDAILETRRETSTLRVKGRQLTVISLSIILLAIIVIGPVCLTIIADVVCRIDAITAAMRALAVNDTTVIVPSVEDRDEVGDMARALRVFKRNAFTLMAHANEIERLNALFDIALNNMALGLSMFDRDGRLVVCNRMYRDLYSLPEELTRPGTSLSEIIGAFSKQMSANGFENLDAAVAHEWPKEELDRAATGEAFTRRHILPCGRHLVVDVRPLPDGGWVDLHKDVTETYRAQARIAELATSDALTGLANRRNFLDCLADMLMKTTSDDAFAVLWLDLDRFKDVNDTHGHPVGDALLKSVAGRLTASMRSTDIVARLGGDEFAAITNGEGISGEQTVALAHRVIAALSQPYEIAGQRIVIGASAGIAIAHQHGSEPDILMKNADVALYRAKTEGRGTAVLYSSEFADEIRLRKQLAADLRKAVETGGLTLHYQPIVDMKLGIVTSCEALMRWRHPERGPIPPSDFIPIAEEIGLIAEMGSWALGQACRDARHWPEHVKVAVNLSADQFDLGDIVGCAVSALDAAGLPPSRLELEVTETVLLKNNAQTTDALEVLREIGVGVALDDFGTGYASLSYLTSFPFTKIKIDQSFVRHLPDRDDCVSIVHAVAALARSLGIRTVAEGVETATHLHLVCAAGCDEVQGYHFSRPVPADDVANAIEKCRALAASARSAA